ncbi:MAG TPA: thermonuclease family protein [Chloroflexia bacterium]|nr:thermonuclease family protein [Chloroflexia bacterium]
MSKPRFTLIKGEFHIFYPDNPNNGPEPDGDTITFRPDDFYWIATLKLDGPVRPDINAKRMVKVRFEGIDALETHFIVDGNEYHQHLAFANAARDHVMNRLGFQDVKFSPEHPNKVISVSNNPRRGYIIADGVDVNGRVLAFVYAGDTPLAEGPYFLETAQLDRSINLDLIRHGLAYGEFYSTLPVELIKDMKNAVRQARRGEGFWPYEDVNSTKSVQIDSLEKLQSLVMWPKLFRRLASFYNQRKPNLKYFDSWLRQDPKNRDDRLLLPTCELGNMHDVVSTSDQVLKLKYEPEDVIILPDNA